MELTKKEKTIKYSIYCGIIALLSLVQSVGVSHFEIGNARCFVLIPATVLLAMGEDEIQAIFTGLFSGVLWDCFSPNHTAFNAVFFTVCCYVLSLLLTHLFRETFWVRVVAVVLTSMLYTFFYWLIFVGAKKAGGSQALISFYFPSCIYTCVVGIVFDFVLTPIKRKLNKE